ncbi:MAG: Tn3 family transposase [Actinobacteria bacterium]|nr:Tn3 family transposase [Actinomycetota bacterium]MCA1697416.1 Tn3 family transposase [Actinomycetota bacterium]
MAYPTEIERHRLERFPEQIAVEDLRACFALSDADRALIFAQRGAANRLGLAVQLCALRFLGFVPDDLAGLPGGALEFVAGQVDAAAHELLEYGARPRTRVDHLARVREHLGYATFDGATAAGLGRWLDERAVEHDAPSVLLALACEHLHARKIIRPSLDRLLRLIATARGAAHTRIEAALADQLAAQRRAELDALLVAPAGGRSELARLRERAGRVGAAELRRQSERYRRLLELRADQIDLSALAPSRRRQLVTAGMRMTAQAIGRLEPARRHPLILAVLAELRLERGDELLDLFDKLLRYADSRARRRVDEERRKTARQRDELAALARQLSRILVESAATGDLPMDRIEREIGLERVRAAATVSDDVLPPLDQQQLDVLLTSHSHLRPAVHTLLASIELDAAPADRAVLDAIKTLDGAQGRLLDEVSLDILPKAWRPWVTEDGRVRRVRYELGLWFAVRDALRAGRLYRPASRRYADPTSFLMPAPRWDADREELAITFGRPLNAGQRLAELEADQRAQLQRLQNAIDAGDGVRLQGSRVVIDPVTAAPSAAAERLTTELARRLPRLEVTELLLEVDAWTQFTAHLTHAGGATPRMSNLTEHLHAALLAAATNLGPTRMAASSDLTYRQLAWATEWYLGDEQLQAANTVLVDYLHRLELAAHWGTGRFSSSDGMRSPARARAAAADPLAREFGWRRGGLTLLSWTSDQYSQYGTKVVSVAEREASHTLDGILHNQTALKIAEHTTDTHGATELVFALFDLLGLSFIPRLRDVGDLRLHRIGAPTGLPVDELLTSKIRPARIADRYDDLLRAAGSLKRGWVPASLLISRMQAVSPKPPLAAALAEYGRLTRTNFLLAYLADAPMRQRIGAQLNKGETMHALRRHVAFGQRQQLPADEDDHRRHALCLELVTNAILAWNARYLTAAIDDVRTTQPDLVTDDALAQLSPVGHAHVNPNGRYRFDTASTPPSGRLRSLRERTATDEQPLRPTPPILLNGDKH